MLGDAPMCASTLGFADFTCDVINGGNHSSDVNQGLGTSFTLWNMLFVFFFLIYKFNYMVFLFFLFFFLLVGCGHPP